MTISVKVQGFPKHTRFLGRQEIATCVHLRLSEFHLAIKNPLLIKRKKLRWHEIGLFFSC